MAKRVFDVVASVIVMVVFLPVMGIIAALVWAESPGSDIVFRGKRIGRFSRPFMLLKFRTMVQDASKIGPAVTAGDDPRVTRVGRVLRKTKLDELPSLWNVVRGDMSLVGPRPENEKSFALYTPEQRAVVDVRPGITSLATLKYRNEEELLAGVSDLQSAYYELMQEKLRIELEYLKRRNLLTDIGVILSTVWVIFQPSASERFFSLFGISSAGTAGSNSWSEWNSR